LKKGKRIKFMVEKKPGTGPPEEDLQQVGQQSRKGHRDEKEEANSGQFEDFFPPGRVAGPGQDPPSQNRIKDRGRNQVPGRIPENGYLMGQVVKPFQIRAGGM
jgi:hypothetical protein